MRYFSRQVDLDPIKKQKTRRRRKRLIITGVIFSLVIAVGVLIFTRIDAVRVLLAPISFIVRLAGPVQLKEVDGRINALVLGLDTQGSSGRMNTDTILVGSFSPTEGTPVLVSIPRDLWLNLSPYGYGRINAAYSRGGTRKDGTFDEEKGVSFAKSEVEEILGIKIPYWVVIDFEGFKQIIDTLGGIEVCVERAFDDWAYPVPGKERAPLQERYKHLHFDAGCQTMGGERALQYARSRSGTNSEGSDFARVRRQQRVIFGVKDKVLSLDLLLQPGKVATLYKQFTTSVKTNANLGEIQRVLEIAESTLDGEDLSKMKSLVLDPDSGLIYHPSNSAPYGGAYVLVPKGGNFAKIHAAVRKLLFGGEEKKP